ncbi:biotin/lipoyl-binding protein, partial [Vibrio parahaemolyticus]|nr:biotin/lipoyl-binding protein [Vibrio parahaemolyticus]
DIMPRVGGELTAIHFNDCYRVEKGQLLFEIDDRPNKAALAYAKASLQKAKAQLVQTTRDEERVNKLIKDKSISEQQYDDAIAAH